MLSSTIVSVFHLVSTPQEYRENGHCHLVLPSVPASLLLPLRVSLQPSTHNMLLYCVVHNSNPLCDDDLSENLVLRHFLLKRHQQISMLALAGGMYYSRKCWQQDLKTNTWQPANCTQILALLANLSVFLSNFSLRESFVVLQSFYCTDIMIDIFKSTCCAPTSLVTVNHEKNNELLSGQSQVNESETRKHAVSRYFMCNHKQIGIISCNKWCK